MKFTIRSKESHSIQRKVYRIYEFERLMLPKTNGSIRWCSTTSKASWALGTFDLVETEIIEQNYYSEELWEEVK